MKYKYKQLEYEITKIINEMTMINPSLFQEYDEIDIFSNKYYIVSKKGKYNLIDRNGKPISKVWFDSIEENDGGLIVKSVDGRTTEIDKGAVCPETMNAINNIGDINIPYDISYEDIVFIEPFHLDTNDGDILIIAKVKYQGQTLYMDSDGILYDKNGEQYVNELSTNYTDFDMYVIPDYSIAYGDNIYEMMKTVVMKRLHSLKNYNVIVKVELPDNASEVYEYNFYVGVIDDILTDNRRKNTKKKYFINLYIKSKNKLTDRFTFGIMCGGNICINRAFVQYLTNSQRQRIYPNDVFNFTHEDFARFAKLTGSNLEGLTLLKKDIDYCKEWFPILLDTYKPDYNNTQPEIWAYEFGYNWSEYQYLTPTSDRDRKNFWEYTFNDTHIVMLDIVEYNKEYGVRESDILGIIFCG